VSQKEPPIQLSEAEIRAVYAAGEEAVVRLVTQLLEQLNQYEGLEFRVKELEGQLSKNSRNSSKPPSGDGFGKRTQSLRSQGERKPGGQADHRGQTLEWSEAVGQVVEHAVQECIGCGCCLEAVPVQMVWARQVYDIPAIELEVTEHRVEVKACPGCGQENQARFPTEVSNVVQYGSRLKSMMVYLMEGQLLPSERTCAILQDLFGVRVSEGTLYNTRRHCFEQLEGIACQIHASILDAEVVHFDETGLRVKGTLWWLHVACTDGLTAYFVHPKRGQAAMEAMAILPLFAGKAIHDGWSSYEHYQECEHFLCNAHHLRELQFVWERYQQPWAFGMVVLLCSIKHLVDDAKAQGQTSLPLQQRQAFADRYHVLLQQGLALNPHLTASPEDAPKPRGRPKQTVPRNLLNRLQSKQASVLGFMEDFPVPFDNHQAERDIRMMKLKQKISGSFRSPEGAQMFCRIRGYLSTLKKQGINVFDALIALFSGNPQSPVPQAE
jgi:transposase